MKRYRLLATATAGLILVLTGLLLFGNLNGNLVYYLTPQEAIAKQAQFPDGRRFQLGGLVAPGSVVRTDGGLRFSVTSGTGKDAAAVAVAYAGAPSQLFQAGIGVVLEGSWSGPVFAADTMIVKHDEYYEPPGSTRARPEAGP